jgi:tetratricopeptide (TPR) repeat protein
MKLKVLILLCYGVQITLSFAQNTQGYWDKERTTTKEAVLYPGARYWIRTDELPLGTTEIVYRITLLDEDQKLISGLADALALIPDPYGISKGSAIALNLFSKISGDDKCYYSIFKNYKEADNFMSSGIYQTACYSNPAQINKDVNRISLGNSNCITEDSRYLWFGFKNTNSIQSEKIVLEIIPWVNYKAARGWTNSIKQQTIENCKNNEEIKKYSDPEAYCLCLLNKVEEKFTYQEYQKLLTVEQNSVGREIRLSCLQETGELNNLFFKEREEAIQLIVNKQFQKAISKYQEIIIQTAPEVTDYCNLGYCYIATKQYSKAIKVLKEGEKIDDSELVLKGNLAHALLLNGDTAQAKTIYLKYKSQNRDENTSWVEMVNTDFEEFNKLGIESEQFKEVRNLLKKN